MHDEGVIKFDARHSTERLEPRRYGEVACELIAWREILARLGLVGRDPRYGGGVPYGNLSARVGPPSAGRGRRSFIITASGTSGRRDVTLADLAVVERYDRHANRVESRGLELPSSESMTHGAVYDLGSHLRFVFHVHSPAIWERRRELGLPTTAPAVAYGTSEMAAEVARLFASTGLSEQRLFAMGGHRDGVVAFGRSAEEAGQTVLGALARAYRAICSSG